jgi:hypothetical protein
LLQSLVYGYTNPCACTHYYFFPIATHLNGNDEHDDYGYQASYGGTYVLQSFVANGQGFSFFDSQYGTPIWSVNWDTYNWYNQNELNYTHTEVHGDGDKPTFTGSMYFGSLRWRDSNGNWNSWGFNNVYNDCPYKGVWFSNTSWRTDSAAC